VVLCQEGLKLGEGLIVSLVASDSTGKKRDLVASSEMKWLSFNEGSAGCLRPDTVHPHFTIYRPVPSCAASIFNFYLRHDLSRLSLEKISPWLLRAW
jgi:hypothetical protein